MAVFVPRRFLVVPNLVPSIAFMIVLMSGMIGLRGRTGAQVPLQLERVAVTASNGALPPDQVVVRARSGQLTLNGTPVTIDQLGERLNVALTGQSQPLVFVDADPAAPYQDAVALMAVVAKAGGKRVGLTPDLSLPPGTTSDAASQTAASANSGFNIAPNSLEAQPSTAPSANGAASGSNPASSQEASP